MAGQQPLQGLANPDTPGLETQSSSSSVGAALPSTPGYSPDAALGDLELCSFQPPSEQGGVLTMAQLLLAVQGMLNVGSPVELMQALARNTAGGRACLNNLGVHSRWVATPTALRAGTLQAWHHPVCEGCLWWLHAPAAPSSGLRGVLSDGQGRPAPIVC